MNQLRVAVGRSQHIDSDVPLTCFDVCTEVKTGDGPSRGKKHQQRYLSPLAGLSAAEILAIHSETHRASDPTRRNSSIKSSHTTLILTICLPSTSQQACFLAVFPLPLRLRAPCLAHGNWRPMFPFLGKKRCPVPLVASPSRISLPLVHLEKDESDNSKRLDR